MISLHKFFGIFYKILISKKFILGEFYFFVREHRYLGNKENIVKNKKVFMCNKLVFGA